MKYQKALSILSCVLFSLTIQNNYGQINNRKDDVFIKKMVEELKSDPVINFEAAYRFSQLPFNKKLKYAKLIGQVVLITSDTTSFLVAFGAEKSPYPWALKVEKSSIVLSANNSFINIFRDDKYIKKQWGEYWTWKNYNTKINKTGPIFMEEKNTIFRFSDLWIPESGWHYVGPKLDISRDTLGADNFDISKEDK